MIGAMGPRMMRLAARYGTMWNVCYTGSADTFVEHIGRFKEACADVGRDPETIEFSAVVYVAFTDLGGQAPRRFDADEFDLSDSVLNPPYLVGSDESMAEELKKYEELGTSHLMFQVRPYTDQAVERLAGVVARYREL